MRIAFTFMRPCTFGDAFHSHRFNIPPINWGSFLFTHTHIQIVSHRSGWFAGSVASCIRATQKHSEGKLGIAIDANSNPIDYHFLSPVSDRVESYEYTNSQLYLSAMFFTALLFLLPTFLAYYVVFASVSELVQVTKRSNFTTKLTVVMCDVIHRG